MTRTEFKELSSEEKRIRVAELCGIANIFKKYVDVGGPAEYYLAFKTNNQGITKEIPDYINDLNAMHEVEATIPEEKELEYTDNLSCLTDFKDGYANIWRTTAEQRAEAFVLTMDSD